MSKKTDILRAFYDRRHPEYTAQAAHWYFLKQTYEGGRQWFSQNIFKFHKEGSEEFSDRVSRSYRFNHTREAVDLVVKYLFKGTISRNEKNASDTVKEFWRRSTLNNLNIDQVMRLASTGNSIFGRVAIVVDTNRREDAVTVAEAKESGSRIYCYVVTADDLLDYAFDEEGDGGLLWVKIRERFRDDADPLNSSGEVVERIRLWTRNDWSLYEEQEKTVRGQKIQNVVEIDRGKHGLGVVPVIFVDHTIGNDPYRVPGLIDDIAYLDRAIANYLSNLDAIIQDQTFSQLAMPAQGLLPGEDTYQKVLELGTKRIFVYDSGAGSNAKPEFISPDPKQAELVLTVINKIINEIYHTIGLAGERTKQDNAVGIDNSSGVAKAYDFERVNSLLKAKASSLEHAENEIIRLVCKWAGEDAPKERLVRYPETFDVMRLADELTVAMQLGKIDAPVEVRREQMRTLVEKLFPRLSDEIKQKMREDIDSWLEGPALALNPPTSFAARSETEPSRQGQVTAETDAKEAA